MKYLVLGADIRDAAAGIPRKQMLQLLKGAKEYWNSLMDHRITDCAYSFPSGGGFAIMNAESPDDLTEILLQFPFFTLLKLEITPLGSINAFYDSFIDVLKKQKRDDD